MRFELIAYQYFVAETMAIFVATGATDQVDRMVVCHISLTGDNLWPAFLATMS
jgi:hypothetical protein